MYEVIPRIFLRELRRRMGIYSSFCKIPELILLTDSNHASHICGSTFRIYRTQEVVYRFPRRENGECVTFKYPKCFSQNLVMFGIIASVRISVNSTKKKKISVVSYRQFGYVPVFDMT